MSRLVSDELKAAVEIVRKHLPGLDLDPVDFTITREIVALVRKRLAEMLRQVYAEPFMLEEDPRAVIAEISRLVESEDSHD